MKRILGLDLGTSSIGWAVVNQAEKENEKSSIVKLGVRVNPLTVDEKGNFEKGKSITTTADRTLKRGMRRNLQRYKQRRDKLKNLLIENNIISEDSILTEDGSFTTYETMELRAKAAKEEITLEELARVLLIINKKRGYKSNRKASNEEDGELIDGMAVARELYNKGITPGQYVYERLKAQKRYKPSFYRSDLQAELETVWNKQAEYYPTLLDDETRKKIEGKGKIDTRKLFYAAHNITAAEEKDRKLRQVTYYYWRATAAKARIEPEQLVTVLSEINGDIAASSGYLGAIGDHSKELEINKMTVGEYLLDLIKKNPHHSLKNIVFYRNDYIHEFNTIWNTQAKFHKELTPELKMKVEGETIFFQRRLKSQKGLISFCELEGKEIVVCGKKVMTGPRVCPKSSPLYQEFKIWQDLNNLILENKTIKKSRKKSDGIGSLFAENEVEKFLPLSKEQKQRLYQELYCTKELTAKDALKVLGLSDKEYSLNYKKLQGNITQVTLLNAYKNIVEMTGHDVDKFDKMDAENKLHLIKAVFDTLDAKNDFLTFNEGNSAEEMQQNAMFKLWHLLYSYEDDNTPTGNGKLVEHISELTGLPHEYASILARVTFIQDFGSLSTKAIRNILPHMKNEGLVYSDACQAAGYNHSKQSLTKEEKENRELAGHLEILPKNSLRNPVVEKIINQMIHVVNGCINEFGQFDEIHIEMARELKQSQKQREETTKHLNAKTKEVENIKKLLALPPFNIPNPSRNDVLRYQLYEELAPNGYKTLYSNTYISKEKLFSRDFDIEHIIPQAKVFDDSYSNKTLESRAINIEKSNMTAIDYVRMKTGDEGVEDFKKRIAFLNKEGSRKKYKNLLTEEDNIENGFLNRDLSDSQYIAKKAKEILQQVSRDVITTTGSITARLREDWQLVDVMKELNWDKFNKLGLTTVERNRDGHEVRRISDWTKRNDHRHHAMDALTIAFTRHSQIQLLNNLNAKDEGDKKDPNIYGLEKKVLLKNGRFVPPMPLDEFRAEAIKHLSKILVSIKAKNKVTTRNVNKIKGSDSQTTLTPRGQLHNETVYGKRQRYATREEKVGASFTVEKIDTVCRKAYRDALMRRLVENNGDPKKAFTGKNALSKTPLFIDEHHSTKVPEKVKTVFLETYFTVRKPISKDLKIDKIVDEGIKRILENRLKEYGNDAAKAFSNLDENPIWLNKEKGITIKNVTIKGVNVATPLRPKRDKHGNIIVKDGEIVPTDFVSTSSNHHIAIFEDVDGNLQEHVVSLYEATARKNQNMPVVDRDYNKELGWKFLFTMKQNEYFVFPDEATGFDPRDIDLTNPINHTLISPHLFRVQKLSTGDYVFRHHLETNVEDNKNLKGITWKRCSIKGISGIIKVRVNHIGHIVKVGEYL
ncbi:MAG: type II CRISPR RNA-guided endonuclease Cas9 [Muribaculaceae bacterium]|nr:type II CRISPR RNA-guided endonuclease Cas9 [Muribaculaceae bacterium]